MSNAARDESREHRIAMEIVVDAYNGAEQAAGWYCYLDDTLNFPFKAKRITPGRSSSEDEVVEVIDMADEEECLEEIFVEVLYREGTVEDTFTAPLVEIEPLDEVNDKTREAVEDWRYWVNQGYEWGDLDDEY